VLSHEVEQQVERAAVDVEFNLKTHAIDCSTTGEYATRQALRRRHKKTELPVAATRFSVRIQAERLA
jgi:hypothetical protein